MQRFRVFADGNLIAGNVVAASQFHQRLRGLISRPPLDGNSGMLLEPCSSVHTFGMSFPIDVVFLDRRRVILEIFSDVQPNRACWAPRGTCSTLELRAGSCADTTLRRGLRLSFEPGAEPGAQ